MLTFPDVVPSNDQQVVWCQNAVVHWECGARIRDGFPMPTPYGWFQWYCRFNVPVLKDAFAVNFCNKILAAGTIASDNSISPVAIRQTLLHWGLDITDGGSNENGFWAVSPAI